MTVILSVLAKTLYSFGITNQDYNPPKEIIKRVKAESVLEHITATLEVSTAQNGDCGQAE
jgi:hypothetical protein